VLFKPKCPVQKDEWSWLLASFKWLDKEFGWDSERDHGLILPTSETFPPAPDDPHGRAQALLNRVKYLCDMPDWPTTLVADEASRKSFIDSDIALKHENHAPLGHFRLLEDQDGQTIGEIAYNPSNLADSISMIATFSHELSHYLMAYAKTVMPGGHDMMEHTTDLCAVYLGFGIFLANNARNFEGFSHGWQYQAAGYLSERSLICALVINEQLQGRNPILAAPYLKSYLQKDLKMAAKYASQFDLHAETDLIDLFEYGVSAYADQRSNEPVRSQQQD